MASWSLLNGEISVGWRHNSVVFSTHQNLKKTVAAGIGVVLPPTMTPLEELFVPQQQPTVSSFTAMGTGSATETSLAVHQESLIQRDVQENVNEDSDTGNLENEHTSNDDDDDDDDVDKASVWQHVFFLLGSGLYVWLAVWDLQSKDDDYGDDDDNNNNNYHGDTRNSTVGVGIVKDQAFSFIRSNNHPVLTTQISFPTWQSFTLDSDTIYDAVTVLAALFYLFHAFVDIWLAVQPYSDQFVMERHQPGTTRDTIRREEGMPDAYYHHLYQHDLRQRRRRRRQSLFRWNGTFMLGILFGVAALLELISNVLYVEDDESWSEWFLGCLSVHLYLLYAFMVCRARPFGHGHVVCLQKTGHTLLVVGSVIDAMSSYVDTPSAPVADYLMIDLFGLISALLWFANAILSLVADCLDKKNDRDTHRNGLS